MGSAPCFQLASVAGSQVQTQLTNHVYATLPAAVIGVICGILGILFTIINLKVGPGPRLGVHVTSWLSPSSVDRRFMSCACEPHARNLA